MQNIRDFLKRIARKNGITMGALTTELGYRSKTSLERLMNGSTRDASLERFEENVRAAFELTEEEQAQLHEAVQVARQGEEQYLVGLKVWDFVSGKQPEQTKELEITDVLTGEPVSLIKRYSGRKVRAAVFNCQYITGLFNLLHALLGEEGVEARHYMFIDSDGVRTMSALNTLMQVFYMKGYSGYTFTATPEEKASHCGINAADAAIFDYYDDNGMPCEDIIVFTGAQSGRLLTYRGAQGRTERLLGIDTRTFESIKRTYFDCGALEDYVRYSENYAALEYNRSIWKLKPDVGVDQIPMHVLAQAFMRAPVPEEVGNVYSEAFHDTFAELRDIYERRFRNTCTKRKPVYTIMKRSAMRRFAQTGKTTDHFWMMEAYTPAERIEILESLLEQQRDNPYMHMYFLKDDDAIRDVEIAYYEDLGMLFLEADTDYNLEAGHSEVLITHQEALRLYREFFTNVLLAQYVLPESETCRFFEELIEEVGRMEDAPEDQ